MSRSLSRSVVACLAYLPLLLSISAMPARAQVPVGPEPPSATEAVPAVLPPLPDAQAPRPLPDAQAPPLAPLPDVKAPLTPPQLVDKSLHDLWRGNLPAVVKDDVAALRRGPLLIHGNYCGIGNRPGSVPTDPLDAACMRHDSCTTDGKIPRCGCDDRLRRESTAIAEDADTTPDMKALALSVAASMAILICR